MRKEPVKHHYIPQFYLRGFAQSKQSKTLFAYDKQDSTSKNMSIKSICYINNLYQISERYANELEGDSKGNQSVLETEHFANTIEISYANIIKEITNLKDRNLQNDKEELSVDYSSKFMIAKCIVIQFLRLPSVKEDIMSIYNLLEQEDYKSIQGILSRDLNMPEAEEIDMDIDEGGAFVYAKIALCNDEWIDSIAGKMANNYWAFNISKTSGFYTSDFPIVVEPFIKNAMPENFGLTQYGGVVTFPLTKDILITICDKELFADKKYIDGRFFVIDQEAEDYYNRLTYIYAKRFVFTCNNDFALINSLIEKQNGEHISFSPNLRGTVIHRMTTDNKEKNI